MADDDLEYHITFPSPTPSTLPATDDGQTPQSLSQFQNQAVSTDDDPADMGLVYSGDGQNYTEKEPVVILLGWVGCKDKYLSKYSDMYDKKGCITIRYTAPPEAIFLNPRRTETIAQKICELIPELGLEDNPIFFHVFSNGGGFVYRSITELLHKDDRYSMVSVRGCVFDSCPGYRRLRSAARAFLATLSAYNVIVQYILGGLLIVYLSLYRIYDSVVSMFQKKDSVHRFFEAMLNDKARWPQLYLYSKADKIIPYEDIEEVLSHRRSLGILVYSVCWDDSPHVAHMRVHPNSYTQQCTYFIDKCLQVSV